MGFDMVFPATASRHAGPRSNRVTMRDGFFVAAWPEDTPRQPPNVRP